MLYGDQETYGEAGAPEPTDLQMGIEPIRVESAVLEYVRLLVTGENFTEYSAVVAGESVLDTVFIDTQHIAVEVARGGDAEFAQSIAVAQINNDGAELGRTAEISVVKEHSTK